MSVQELTPSQKNAAHRRATAISYKLPPPEGMSVGQRFRRLLRLSQKARFGWGHSEDKCRHQDWPCPIHRPSVHKMADWPWIVRYDKESLTERVCKHGIGHPDPDSLVWLERRGLDTAPLRTHACDGCCGNAS